MRTIAEERQEWEVVAGEIRCPQKDNCKNVGEQAIYFLVDLLLDFADLEAENAALKARLAEAEGAIIRWRIGKFELLPLEDYLKKYALLAPDSGLDGQKEE